MTYVVASFSGGKDSTAMVLHMIELGEQLDEVVTCDTGMEFPAMYEHIEKVCAIIEGAGIKYTTLRADKSFEDMLLNQPPTDKRSVLGYGWPGVHIRWCTKFLKTTLLRKYTAEHPDAIQCVGLALDEQDRRERERTTRTSATLSPNGAGPRRTPSNIAERGVSIGADYTIFSSGPPAGYAPFNPSPSSANYGSITPNYGPGSRNTTGSSRTASITTGDLRVIESRIIPSASRGRPAL